MSQPRYSWRGHDGGWEKKRGPREQVGGSEVRRAYPKLKNYLQGNARGWQGASTAPNGIR